ncbi:tRNA dihydrouridine synthase DusB [Candidatus Omnitrophota bacterium]
MHSLFPRVILAPLAGISSLPFRTLNRNAGCKFAFLEMLNARSLSCTSKKTLRMMLTDRHDRPLGVQLLGKDTYYISKALEKLKDYPYDVLDFNAACPQKKITSHGRGAALLKCPKELQKLLAAIVKQVTVPVTTKLRIGWDNGKNAVDIAKYVQDAGVKAVCVHGRTKAQGYRSPVNYSAIKKVKAALSIPVIGSGDIWSGQMAKKMFDETGCDGVAIARGAFGNPWIFNEIDKFLDTGKIAARPTIKEVSQTMKQHLDLYLDFYGERVGVIQFRKFYIWYTRGFSKTKPLRGNVSHTRSGPEMTSLIEKFVSSQELNV